MSFYMCVYFSQDQWIPASIRNTLNEMIDVDLLKEPVMLLLCISNLLGMLGFYVPFMFLINMAVRKGMPTEDASLLLSLIGITNTLGSFLSSTFLSAFAAIIRRMGN